MTAFLRLPPLHPERAIEWLIGMIGLSWGAVVLSFTQMFDSQPSLYGGMSSIMPQPLWGIVAFADGLIRLGALYINGNHFRTPTIRMVTSFISMLIWFSVFVGLLKTGVPQMGWAIYPCLLIGDLWSVYRASQDAYKSNLLHKKLKTVVGGTAGVHRSR